MAVVSMILHVVNIALLIILLFIYIQNYKQVKSKITSGLLIFALLFLLQGSLNIYIDTTMVMYSSDSAETAATILEAIKTTGLSVLLWITWR